MGQYKRRKSSGDLEISSDTGDIVISGSNVLMQAMGISIPTTVNVDTSADATSWKAIVDHSAIVADLVVGIHAQLSAQMGALESAIINVTVN